MCRYPIHHRMKDFPFGSVGSPSFLCDTRVLGAATELGSRLGAPEKRLSQGVAWCGGDLDPQ